MYLTLLNCTPKIVKRVWGTWLAQSVEHETRGLRVVSLSPMLGVEITYALSLSVSKINKCLKKKKSSRDAWVVQSVKCLTLDFSSGHDLAVLEFELRVGLLGGSVEPAWKFLSPSLCPSLHTLSLSQNK